MAPRYDKHLAQLTRGAQKRLAEQEALAHRLKTAIRTHHREVHAGNWGADDALWEAAGLEADPEVIG